MTTLSRSIEQISPSENCARIAGMDGREGGPLSFGLPYVDVIPGEVARTGMGWPIHADGFRDLLLRLSADCGPLQLYISENGFAGNDYRDQLGQSIDSERIGYLELHLRAVRSVIASGADICGYWQWSFMNNFEWGFGYSMRFGLVHVDYPTRERTPILDESLGLEPYQPALADYQAALASGDAHAQADPSHPTAGSMYLNSTSSTPTTRPIASMRASLATNWAKMV